jgi:glycosyltransferase involved in cell wall biosynthesis
MVSQHNLKHERRLRVCYGASRYLSFARVARTYHELIGQTHTMVDGLQDADLAILHCEPHYYRQIFQRFPSLRSKYVIGCATWETSHLPNAYVEGIQLVNEVWTCSRYCQDIFQTAHPNVILIPHAIQRNVEYSPSDMEFVKSRIDFKQECQYGLAVTHINDSRKNVFTLIDAFGKFHRREPRCRLVVKGFESDHKCPETDGIITITEYFSESQMNALYAISSFYVSAHHSEGWGLALADALLFGLPIIATGYSGNLDYMDSSSAFLIPCEQRHIEDHDCYGMFDNTMSWAYVNSEEIVGVLHHAYLEIISDRMSAKRVAAAGYVQKYSETSVGDILQRRLETIMNLG